MSSAKFKYSPTHLTIKGVEEGVASSVSNTTTPMSLTAFTIL